MEWDVGEFKVSDDRSLLSVDRVCELLAETYKEAPRSRERNEVAIRNSICYGVYHKDEQVGYIRVVTDFATMYWICDFIIDKRFRGRGLGKKITDLIVNHYKKQCELGLLGTRDTHGLYEKCGFIQDSGLFMYRPSKG